MQLKVYSPEKIIFDEAVKSVTFPGTLGGFQILDLHAPFISSLKSGNIVIQTESEERVIEVESGFVEVLKHGISALVEE
mgnify:CR=1 FL=1